MLEHRYSLVFGALIVYLNFEKSHLMVWPSTVPSILEENVQFIKIKEKLIINHQS